MIACAKKVFFLSSQILVDLYLNNNKKTHCHAVPSTRSHISPFSNACVCTMYIVSFIEQFVG